MLYGNELIGLFVDKSFGYYYSFTFFMFNLTISGNELVGHSVSISIFNLQLSVSIL